MYLFICRIGNPDIPRAGRHGAAHGGTAGPGRDRQHRTPTGRFVQEKTTLFILQTMEKCFPRRFFGSTNKANSM